MEQKGLHRSTEENRRLILWAAARLFVQNGYTATTLRQIAKEAGINIGSLMYAYESKECILVEVCARWAIYRSGKAPAGRNG